MTFTARRATPADLDTLVSFTLAEAAAAEGRHMNEVTLRRGILAGLEDPTVARYWVLESAEAGVVGSISIVREWSDWYAAYYWWIQSMFLLPAYRGRDLMTPLIDTVLQQAKAEHVLEVRLYVHKDNARAIRAYEKQGFMDAPYRVMRQKASSFPKGS